MGNTIQVMLIRHGETAENRERRYCGGGSDSLLSAEGAEQIRLNRKKGVYDAALQYPGRLIAVSSDLRRAVDTLDLILYGETVGEEDSDCNAREGAFNSGSSREGAFSGGASRGGAFNGGSSREWAFNGEVPREGAFSGGASRGGVLFGGTFQEEALRSGSETGLFRTVAPGLREMEFGIFEGKTYEQLVMNPHYRRWIRGDNEANVCPGGESGLQMKRRVLLTYNKILSVMTGDDEPEPKEEKASPEETTARIQKMKSSFLLVVTHGGPVAAVMQDAFPHKGKNRYEWQPACGCGYLLEYVREYGNLRPSRYEEVGPRDFE